VNLHTGDCLDVLRTLPADSVDAIVTDPPYGLAFMGKKWDYDVPSEEIWRECLRVLKPGGHLLAFAGTRTQHRMAVRIEDAGFEIRDMIAWVYGSGFPKSLDVSKAIDKAAGYWRGKAGEVVSDNGAMSGGNYDRTPKGDPITAAAAAWQGWGTALKPALEPITVARKPLIGTVAENVLAHGTGALNVDGCRVGDEVLAAQVRGVTRMGTFEGADGNETPERIVRWPANLIHDGSEEVVGLLNDAARFFYCAKASKRDRDDGNNHPTVKPTDLMRYLCRLVTPPNGLVLDPFTGSGSTGKAAMLEGFRFAGCELSAEYIEIARARIAHAAGQTRQKELALA
jgi:site-specific DNA-methyltransferase (adenine-specific)